MAEPLRELRPERVASQPVTGLLERLPGARLHGSAVSVAGITHDSRRVRPGDLYLARAGEHVHGVTFVPDVLAAGAAAVLTDPASVPVAVSAGADCVVEVPDPRAVAGPAAAWVYGDPSQALSVVGITGTNGKTTTAYLVEAGLRAAGRRTGLIGTIESHIAGTAIPSQRTTPEAPDLQALFAVMRERSVTDVVMEVSSHALALDRIAGTIFAIAAFTNLSQDHLDFHGDMESYFEAKARLFTPALSRRAIVVVDDDWGRRLSGAATVPVTTVGSAEADWLVTEVTPAPAGGEVVVRAPDGGRHRLEVSIAGEFNLRNAALAFVILCESGVPPVEATAGLAGLRTVPGRMERVAAGQPFIALVDYAHTPVAVTALLTGVRGLVGPEGRVIVVLGCGGDRDTAKRPLMGAAAAAGADIAVLTSDNPRSEDPLVILEAMLAGVGTVADPGAVVVEPDRRRAIDKAVAEARAGDVVVVAGKGHEQGQEQDGEVHPFDDRDVLRESLQARAHPALDGGRA